MPPVAPLSLVGMPAAVPGKMLACGTRTGRPAGVRSLCTGGPAGWAACQPAGPQVSPPDAQVLPLDAQESPPDALLPAVGAPLSALDPRQLSAPAAAPSAPGARQLSPPNALQVCAPEAFPFRGPSPALRVLGLDGRLGRNQLDTGCAVCSAAAVRSPLRWPSAVPPA